VNLRAEGALSEEEFVQAKANLLEEGNVNAPADVRQPFNANQWAMCIHLSQFSSLVLGPLGFFVPIVLWQMRKDADPFVDSNGKNVTNWVISCNIYIVISAILCFLVVGFVLVPIFIILSLVFPVIGAVKAAEGKL